MTECENVYMYNVCNALLEYFEVCVCYMLFVNPFELRNHAPV